MKKIIGLTLLLVTSGCSKNLSDEAKLNCERFSKQMDSYIVLMRDDPSNAKSNFEPIYSDWLNISDSIPSCAQKKRVENSMNLHRLALINVSVLSLYTKTSDGMELLPNQQKQWETECQKIHQKIDKKYIKYLIKKTHSEEVRSLLKNLVSTPTAICPQDRMGNPALVSEIVKLNIEEGNIALNQLTK